MHPDTHSPGHFGAARGTGAALRWALAGSLLIHAGLLLWLSIRPQTADEAPRLHEFEVSLELASATSPVALAPADAAEQPELIDAEPAPPIDAPQSMPVLDETAAPPASSLPQMRRRLNLAMPPGSSGGRDPGGGRGRDTGVFDPAFDAVIRQARAARTSAPARFAPPSVSPDAGDGRQRIETAQGCYQRVVDPFDALPGDAWWLVQCASTKGSVDWGQRFTRDR